MSNRAFVDSDVILDFLAQREGFYSAAKILFTRAEQGLLELYTTAIVFANVFYILRKTFGNEAAKTQLKLLRSLVRVLPVGEACIDKSLESVFTDFEDGMQYFAAKENNLSVLLTRNGRDYKEKDLLIQTPQEFLNVACQGQQENTTQE